MGRAWLRASSLLLLSLLTLAPTGCSALNSAGAAIAGTSVVKPLYPTAGGGAGFKDQSIAVMAWADDSLRYEHNMLIMDITRGVSQKLQGSQARKAEELVGATFPREKGPDAMYAFQMNHPEVAADPIADIAPRFGVTRLIYIEVASFDLHSGAVVDLSRGALSATVTVVEVSNGKGKVAFTAAVDASYPEKGPDEGTPNLTDQQTYIGTVDQFCTNVVKKFVTYPGEEE
jgi:hypothetical protein